MKTFTLHQLVTTAFFAARGVNSTGSIAVLAAFTDGRRTGVKISLP